MVDKRYTVDGDVLIFDGTIRVRLADFNRIQHVTNGKEYAMTFYNKDTKSIVPITIKFESKEEHDKCLNDINNERIKVIRKKE